MALQPRAGGEIPGAYLGGFDESAFSIRFPFAASQGRDRQGDFLEVAGIDCSRHRANPIAFLDHGRHPDAVLPIGITESPHREYTVEILEDQGLAVAKVFLAKESKVARQAFGLFKAKILRAGSIGYRTIRARKLPADPEQGLKGGLHILACELLEVSLVSMPVNGDAVAKALERTWEGEFLGACFKSMLLPFAPRRRAWARSGWEAQPAHRVLRRKPQRVSR
jgi:hypothetical protein